MKNHLIPVCSIIFLFSISFHAQAQIITTIAGNGTPGYISDGVPATSTELKANFGVAVDGAGNVYIADAGNNRIRKVNTSGIISTVAGNGTPAFSGDGGQATAAELNAPTCVAFDNSGNMYIADQNNNRVRMINTSGIINTFAGGGSGTDGGPATAINMIVPLGVAVDQHGNVYIAEYGFDHVHIVNTAGIINLFAGNGTLGSSGDGGSAIAAELFHPTGVSVDKSGNVYIDDYGNNKIRKVDASGKISTFAGNGTAGYIGDGTTATATELNEPQSSAFDTSGNLYIADLGNQRIRKINTSGIISTIAGDGTAGYNGDGILATTAEISYPTGVFADNKGNIYISDQNNNRVRKIIPNPALSIIDNPNKPVNISLRPNPVADVMTIDATNFETGKITINITDISGSVLLQKEINNNDQSFSVSFDIKAFSPGIYFVIVRSEGQLYKSKIVKE
jgi:sugar lactone lactonase YvrE